MPSRQQLSLFGAGAAFALLTLAASLLLTRYVGLERTYYHWDHALYPGFADGVFRLIQDQGWGAALRAVRDSFNDDFSRLFTLPAVLGFSLTGNTSRAAYCLANFLAYGVSLALVLAVILRQVRGGFYGGNAVLALGALLFCGFAWVSLAEGYPDLGGAALLAGALALLLRDWPQVRAWHWLAAGLLLAAAIIFRRHYIYPAAALLAAAGAVQLFWFWRARWSRTPGVYPPPLGPLLAGVTIMAALYVLAPQFMARLVTMRYPELYAAYAEPAGGLLDKDLSRLGGVGLLLALTGYALAWRNWPLQRARLALLLVFFGIWAVLWFGWVRFGGQHYLSQLFPIILPLGWALLGVNSWSAGRSARLVAGGAATFLALQALLTFWLADCFLPANALPGGRQLFTGLLAEVRPPRQRSDYDAIGGLVGYLAHSLRPDDKVAVLASSPIFNQDILMTAVMARRAALGTDDFIPLIGMPDVDRRDPLPLDAVNQATVLLLVTPPQYHLGAEGQQVVAGAIGLLTEDADFSGAWQRDASNYQLEQGAVLSIWRLQQPWTPAVRAQFLSRLRQRAAASGSLPQDWVTQRADLRVRSLSDVRNHSLVSGSALTGGLPVQLFFSLPLSSGAYRLSGRAQAAPGCALRLFAQTLSGAGALLQEQSLPLAVDGRFAVALGANAAQPYYLQLSLLADSPAPACDFELSDLTVLRE